MAPADVLEDFQYIGNCCFARSIGANQQQGIQAICFELKVLKTPEIVNVESCQHDLSPLFASILTDETRTHKHPYRDS